MNFQNGSLIPFSLPVSPPSEVAHHGGPLTLSFGAPALVGQRRAYSWSCLSDVLKPLLLTCREDCGEEWIRALDAEVEGQTVALSEKQRQAEGRGP